MSFQKKKTPLLVDTQLNILHKNIIKIALRLRKKQRIIDMFDLFEKCCQELPNPEPEIDRALRELYELKFFVKGKQLYKLEILKNSKRNQIFEHILKYPGVHERELRKVFNLGAYEAHTHLTLLHKFGFIKKKKFKNRNAYFHIEFDEAQELKTLLLRNETAKQVYECVKQGGQLRLSEIADILQVSHSTIQSHLKDLTNGGLLKKTQQDQITYYVNTSN